MFEYILIGGVNDSNECAYELAELIKNKIPLKLAFINLIRYNFTNMFKAPDIERVKTFKEILEARGIEVTERYRFGHGIKAACGQLTTVRDKQC